MTAGRGVQHEENAPEGTIAHTLQLWVNLPAAAKMTEPRYQNLVGAPKIGDAGTLVQVNQLAWLTRSDEPGSSELTLKSESTAVRLLIFAGHPLREPIAFGGPFVMNTQAETRQAFADFRAGRL